MISKIIRHLIAMMLVSIVFTVAVALLIPLLLAYWMGAVILYASKKYVNGLSFFMNGITSAVVKATEVIGKINGRKP